MKRSAATALGASTSSAPSARTRLTAQPVPPLVRGSMRSRYNYEYNSRDLSRWSQDEGDHSSHSSGRQGSDEEQQDSNGIKARRSRLVNNARHNPQPIASGSGVLVEDMSAPPGAGAGAAARNDLEFGGERDYDSFDEEDELDDSKRRSTRSGKSLSSGRVPPKTRNRKRRSTKACLACREQKVKCQGASNPPCERCKKLKFDCKFTAGFKNNAELTEWQIRVESSLQYMGQVLNAVIGTLAVAGLEVPRVPNPHVEEEQDDLNAELARNMQVVAHDTETVASTAAQIARQRADDEVDDRIESVEPDVVEHRTSKGYDTEGYSSY
ncbi:hypothetical protein OIV83_005027 [Microbotryomycetes sp. JL201]|nr:hypothetical protein OIV83_005027 [Microbotryomycetes sp. JL201]